MQNNDILHDYLVHLLDDNKGLIARWTSTINTLARFGFDTHEIDEHLKKEIDERLKKTSDCITVSQNTNITLSDTRILIAFSLARGHKQHPMFLPIALELLQANCADADPHDLATHQQILGAFSAWFPTFHWKVDHKYLSPCQTQNESTRQALHQIALNHLLHTQPTNWEDKIAEVLASIRSMVQNIKSHLHASDKNNHSKPAPYAHWVLASPHQLHTQLKERVAQTMEQTLSLDSEEDKISTTMSYAYGLHTGLIQAANLPNTLCNSDAILVTLMHYLNTRASEGELDYDYLTRARDATNVLRAIELGDIKKLQSMQNMSAFRAGWSQRYAMLRRLLITVALDRLIAVQSHMVSATVQQNMHGEESYQVDTALVALTEKYLTQLEHNAHTTTGRMKNLLTGQAHHKIALMSFMLTRYRQNELTVSDIERATTHFKNYNCTGPFNEHDPMGSICANLVKAFEASLSGDATSVESSIRTLQQTKRLSRVQA